MLVFGDSRTLEDLEEKQPVKSRANPHMLLLIDHFAFPSQGEKNIELGKRKPDYRPYDEPETDELGMVRDF